MKWIDVFFLWVKFRVAILLTATGKIFGEIVDDGLFSECLVKLVLLPILSFFQEEDYPQRDIFEEDEIWQPLHILLKSSCLVFLFLISLLILSTRIDWVPALSKEFNTGILLYVRDLSSEKHCSFLQANWCYIVTDRKWSKELTIGPSQRPIRWRTAEVRRFWPLMSPQSSGTRPCGHWIWGIPRISHARLQVSVQFLRFPAPPARTSVSGNQHSIVDQRFCKWTEVIFQSKMKIYGASTYDIWGCKDRINSSYSEQLPGLHHQPRTKISL